MKNIFIIIGLFLGILSGNSQTRYTINTTTSAGGRIATTLQVDSGTNYRLTYKADSNYRIDSIIINDTLNAKDSLNGYTFRNVGSNQKIRLVFKRVYFIAILKNRGLLLKDTLKADSGKNFRVNFTADSGFRIDSIFVNANRISLDSINGYTFSNVTSNYSIRLSLRKIFVILTTTNAGGIIEDTLRIDSAQNAQVLFYPDSGYFLDTLVINKTTMVYDSINSYTFYNVQSNQKAAAMFSPFCASIDSSILSYDSSAHLDSFLVTAPNCRWQAVANVPWISIRNVKNTGTGYVKFSIQANTDTLNRVGIITVGDKQRVVEQRYLPLTYYLNVYEQYNQLLILKNTIEVQENSNKLFKINTTPTNFAFVEIVLDSTIIHDTSLLLSRINANHKIVFKYQYISNNSFTTIQNGIISPINLDVDRGANVRFSYVPDSGYEFDYVIANGEVNYDSPTNFTLYNIDTNSHLDVFFKPIYRTITVNKTYKTNNKITYQEKFIYPENAQFANANYIFIDTVNNVKITFPIDSQNQNIQVAVTKVNNIDTMLPFYGGNSYKRVGAVYSIDLLNIDTSGIFKLVTIPYNPNLVSDPQNIEAAYYNDSLGKWLSAGVVSIDTIYHNISLYTNHFSRWTIYSNEKITTDFPDFDTGFRPDKDGFYFPNDLPVPYNDPKGRNGESANGNCFGFSAISLLYYIFKDLNAINLYNLSFNGPPIISENKYNTPVYRNFNILLYESIFHTSEYLNNSEATNNLVTFTDYEKTKKSYNDKSLTSLFYNELMKFKSPFIGLFQLAGEIGNSNFIRWFKGPGHVVVFYRYKKNNDGTGRFYYYDNNIPGEELFITHNKDGSFPNNVLASLSSTKEPFKIAKYGTISLGQYDIQTVLNLMGSNFVPLYFNVTTSIDYGTISPSKQIRQGDIYTINYSINSNRVLDYIEYSDGIYVYPLRYYSTNFNTIKITENSFTIKVYKDYYVKVFTKPKPQINQYTLTTSITNGSISPTIAIDAASNYTITFTANSGYLINSVYINGQKYIGSSLGLGSSRGSYTFNNIKANATIAVYCTAKNDPYDPTLTTLTLANLEANMVTLPGGTFTMGATPKQISDGFSPWWSPTTQQVTLSTYKICKFEVTQQLWLAVMGSNPSYFTGNLQRPVEQVSWDDCQAFITKLNQLTGKNYRLPTEAEWEYAARGGNNNDSYIFSGSNNLDAVAWYVSNSGNTTHTVGTKQANQLGLYDMSGNVWEWCSDWYGNYSGSAVTNPTGPISGTFRVSRGGSWNGGGYNYRVSTRYSGYPYTRSYSVGLRLVSAP